MRKFIVLVLSSFICLFTSIEALALGHIIGEVLPDGTIVTEDYKDPINAIRTIYDGEMRWDAGKKQLTVNSKAGTATGGIRYKTIGYGIMINISGVGKFAINTNLGGAGNTTGFELISETSDGSYTYSQRQMSLDTLQRLFEGAFPGYNFSSITQYGVTTTITVNPIYTERINGREQGSVAANGTLSGKVFVTPKGSYPSITSGYLFGRGFKTAQPGYDPPGIVNARDWDWETKVSLTNSFNKTVVIYGDQKPIPPVPNVWNDYINVEEAKYISGGTYFMNGSESFVLETKTDASAYTDLYRLNASYALIKKNDNSHIAAFSAQTPSWTNSASNGAVSTGGYSINVTDAYSDRPSGTSLRARWRTHSWDEGYYYVYPLGRIYKDNNWADSQMLKQTGWMQDNKKKLIAIDKTAPTVGLIETERTHDRTYLTAGNFHDRMSGEDWSSVEVGIQYGSGGIQWGHKPTWNASRNAYQIGLASPATGTVTMYFYIRDNVGNARTVSQVVQPVVPDLINGPIEVSGEEYFSNGTYYVNGTSPFTFVSRVRGTFDNSKYRVNNTFGFIRNDITGAVTVYNSKMRTNESHYSKGEVAQHENSNNFSMVDGWTDRAMGWNFLSGSWTVIAGDEGLYTLAPHGRIYLNDNWYDDANIIAGSPQLTDAHNFRKLVVDKTAPVFVNPVMGMASHDADVLTFGHSGLSDPNQYNSGVKVWAMDWKLASEEDSAYRRLGVASFTTGWSSSINFREVEGGKYKDYDGLIDVRFYAEDNVGNSHSQVMRTHKTLPKSEVTNAKIYKEKHLDGDIRWVNTRDPFEIYISTAFDSKYERFTNGNHAYLTKNTANILQETSDYVVRTYTTESQQTSGTRPQDLERKDRDVATQYTGASGSRLLNYTISTSVMQAKDSGHGNIVPLYGYGSYDSTYGSRYWSDAFTDGHKLGIDAFGPVTAWKQIDRNEVRLTINDEHSGIKNIDVIEGNSVTKDNLYSYKFKPTFQGKGKKLLKYEVNIGDNKSTQVITEDMVGNRTFITIPDIQTNGTGMITTKPIVVGGRHYLEATAKANVHNTSYDTIISTYFRGDGININHIESNVIHKAGTTLNHTTKIDDTTNTPDQPNAAYTTNDKHAEVSWPAMADLMQDYRFDIQEKDKVTIKHDTIDSDGNVNTTTEIRDYEFILAEKNDSFASGYKDYAYKLERISDEEYVTYPAPKLIEEAKKDTLSYDMSDKESGDYRFTITMYDKNENPSGTKVLNFRHVQPFAKIESDLDITAVKDIDWEKATYPINYKKDRAKFPVGSAYKFNNQPINMGYGINYTLKRERMHEATDIQFKYKFIDHSTKQELQLFKDGTNLVDSDRREGTEIVTANRKITKVIMEDELVRMKHYVPTPEAIEVRTASGAKYTGKIEVHLDVKFIKGSADKTDTYILYTVDPTTSALDDLESDKLR